MKRLTCLIAALLALASSAFAAGETRDERVDDALRRANQYLLSQQDAVTGAIHNRMRNETAMTSLAILALGSCGHQPSDKTLEGRAMKRALDFVLQPDNQEPDGYYGRKDGSRMYGHGITSLMLAEMLGMGADTKQDATLRDKTHKAIDLILRAQKVPKNENNRGGWRYSPDAGDSDMSVTVWQTMALRAARNSGFSVPKEAIDEAMRYIKRCYEPARESKRGVPALGGFGYQGRGRELSTTAEGLLALLVCGDYESEEVKGASERLLRDGIKPGERWFFYTTYYYAQSMYQRGGKFATEGERVTTDVLLPLQSREGWWEGLGGEERGGGKVYATAMAVLSLAVKNHFLPIYQR
ncbi:MAG: prenyltransferase/squalene oxidase repeat-containing protein [Chthoniobacteraceae bacterium]